MNEKLTAKLMQKELLKRSTPPPNILEDALDYQKDFILDPAKRKVICSTRRSGKSYTLVINLIHEALKTEQGIFAFLSLTNESCKKIFRPILQQIANKHKLKLNINSKNNIEFPNGSIIYLIGLDSTPKQMDRCRGVKYNLVCVDECQDFTQNLREVIENVLDIALAQSQATLIMAGTPGDSQGNHYFYQVNKPNSEEKEWKKFFFDWRKNISIDKDSGMSICQAIQIELDRKISQNPLITTTDAFRQEWLGEWIIRSDSRIYQCTPQLNYIQQLPNGLLNQNTVYILSVDLGFTDASAFVVSAHNRNLDNKMYILESAKIEKLHFTGVAHKIKEYQQRYKFQNIVVDAANLQGVEELRIIHGLPLHAADKHGKEAHIAVLNADFKTGLIKIYEPMNKDLIEELETLIWSQKDLIQGKHKENSLQENHLCDSLLYNHTHSRHYWFEVKPVINPHHEDEIRKALINQHIKMLNQNKDTFEVNYEQEINL